MVSTYVIFDVPLIPQDLGMACWYASAKMLIQWRRNHTQSTEEAFPDPSEVDSTVALYKANNGLPFNQMIEFGQLMGLQPIPPSTPTMDAISAWLQFYGPIWTCGLKVTATASYGHVVVIVGISEDGFLIHDPEPVGVGTEEWKPFSWLDTTLSTGGNQYMVGNFLHFPG